MLTNTTNGLATMTFSEFRKDDMFNFIVSNVTVDTNQQIVSKVEEDTLTIIGKIDNVEKLIVTDKYGDATIVTPTDIEVEEYGDNDVIYRNTIKTARGVPTETILQKATTKTTDTSHRRNRYTKTVVYKDILISIDSSSRNLIIFDFNGAYVRSIRLNTYINSIHNIFDVGEHICISGTTDKQALYKISKEDIYLNRVDASVIEKMEFVNSTDKPFDFSNYQYDFMYFNNNIYFTAKEHGFFKINLSINTITTIKDEFGYSGIHTIIINDGKLYVVGSGNETNVYELIISDSLEYLDRIFSHNYRLSNTNKAFMVVNNKILAFGNSIVLDIDKKTAYYYPSNYPRISIWGQPIFVGNRVIYNYDAYFYKADFDDGIIEFPQSTKIKINDYEKDLNDIEYVTEDIGLNYSIVSNDTNEELVPELKNIRSTGLSGGFSYQFSTTSSGHIYSFSETVTIEKNKVRPDKLLTYIYEI